MLLDLITKSTRHMSVTMRTLYGDSPYVLAFFFIPSTLYHLDFLCFLYTSFAVGVSGSFLHHFRHHLHFCAFTHLFETHEWLKRQTFIEALCHGNLYEEEALGIANIFKLSLVKTVLPPESRPQERVVKLSPGSSLLHTANVKNNSEENSVVEV